MISYKHPQVVRRFAKEYPNLAQDAELIFEDLMRFFWAGRLHEKAKNVDPSNPDLDFIYIMDEEMKSIDQMWHIFLLYTKDYMAFCEEHFGEYLHHLPDIVDRIEAKDTNQQKFFEQNLKRFLNFTYDHLGEDVILRWYAQHV